MPLFSSRFESSEQNNDQNYGKKEDNKDDGFDEYKNGSGGEKFHGGGCGYGFGNVSDGAFACGCLQY